MPKITVEISPFAFSKIIDWTSSNTEREVGGYLIGTVQGSSVLISDSTFAVASSTPTHVALDEMAQYRIIKEIEKREGQETIVGFWHTHPGMKCYLSGTDIATQKVYQALLPEAVAMVNNGNTYAQTRDIKDFDCHFFRVKGEKYHEVSYAVTTDPNSILGTLTDFFQEEENTEAIIERMAQKTTFEMQTHFKELLVQELISKKELQKAMELLRNDLNETSEGLLIGQEKYVKTIEEIISKTDNNIAKLSSQISDYQQKQNRIERKKKLLLYGVITVMIVVLILNIVLILQAVGII
jgi:proteasome lid subunit RPN8/RPN11